MIQPPNTTSLLRQSMIFVLVLAGWLQWVDAETPSQEKWTITGSLGTARQYHTATLLKDGRVLVVGGYGTSSELSTVELYDPAAGAFTRASDLAHCRSNHTATLLLNGLVLVVGGQAGGSTLSSSELYNPSTDKWTATSNLHIARSYHTATLLADGEVLVTGGIHWASPPVFAQGAPPGSALDVAELYDPATGKWTVTDSMHTARYAHAATLLSNGDVLVVGGIGQRRSPMSPQDELRDLEEAPRISDQTLPEALNSAELFDHKTKIWSATSNLLYPRFNLTATLLPSGQVLVAGGQSNGTIFSEAELYSASTATWAPTGSLQTSRNGHTATLLPNGEVIAVGGANNSGALSSAELFNPILGTWQETASMNQPHSLHTATLLMNGKLLVCAGGYELGSPGYDQALAESYEVIGHAQSIAQNAPTLNVCSGIANPPPAPSDNVSLAVAGSASTPPSLLTAANCLVLVTICVVIITDCVVVLLVAWSGFVIIRRFCK